MAADRTIRIVQHPTGVEARFSPPIKGVDAFQLVPTSPGMYLNCFNFAATGIIAGVVMNTAPSERARSSAAAALVYAAQSVDRRYKLIEDDEAIDEPKVMKVGLVAGRTKLALAFHDHPVERQAIAAQVGGQFASVEYIPNDGPEVRAALINCAELPRDHQSCMNVLGGIALALDRRLDVQRRAA